MLRSNTWRALTVCDARDDVCANALPVPLKRVRMDKSTPNIPVIQRRFIRTPFHKVFARWKIVVEKGTEEAFLLLLQG